MEELPWSVKIVGLLACIGAIFLLAAKDLVFKKFKRTPKPLNKDKDKDKE